MAANLRMHSIDGESRKRSPLPSSSDLSVPPNKRIPKPMAKEQREKNKREKELLHQRSALESRVPFYLQPRIPFSFPVIHQSSPCSKPYARSIGSPSYPYLPTPSTPSNSSYSVSNLVGETTPTPKPPQSPYSYAASTKQQTTTTHGFNVFSPWSQNSVITGLPTPPSNESLTNKEFDTHSVKSNSYSSITHADSSTNEDERTSSDERMGTASKNPGIPSHAFSPYSTRVPGMVSPSPFFYMYNHTPLSPVVLLGSPCGPSSVKSVPSVSSSSGCSSMSEGSVLSVEKMNTNYPRIAPTEYHVGIKPPSQAISLERGSTSDGVVTPTPESDDDEIADVDVERVESCSNISSTMQLTNATMPSNGVPIDHRCPLSVQSLISNKSCPPMQQYLPQDINHHSNVSSPDSSRESSPEPECEDEVGSSFGSKTTAATQKSAAVNGDDIFCLVPGRLSLLSATQKYKITVDEVKRRLSNPECLNASVLGGILRRAKSKNGGHHLRQRLEEKGLSLPPGRRKATEITLFTSMVEGEALHLANDHKRICQNFFPHQELAQIIGRQHVNTPQVQERLRMVDGARVLLSEFQAMVDAAGRPSNLQPNDPSNPYPGLTNFNLISHGFGNASISTAVSVIQHYLQELSRIYDNGNPHLPPPPNSNSISSMHPAAVGATRQLPTQMENSSSNYGRPAGSLFTSPLAINLLKQEPNEL